MIHVICGDLTVTAEMIYCREKHLKSLAGGHYQAFHVLHGQTEYLHCKQILREEKITNGSLNAERL